MNLFSCTSCVFCDWCCACCYYVKKNVNQQESNNNIIKVPSPVITTQPLTGKSDDSDFEFAEKMKYVTMYRGANEHRRLDGKITIDRN